MQGEHAVQQHPEPRRDPSDRRTGDFLRLARHRTVPPLRARLRGVDRYARHRPRAGRGDSSVWVASSGRSSTSAPPICRPGWWSWWTTAAGRDALSNVCGRACGSSSTRLPPYQELSLAVLSSRPDWVMQGAVEVDPMREGIDRIDIGGRSSRLVNGLAMATEWLAADAGPYRGVLVVVCRGRG